MSEEEKQRISKYSSGVNIIMRLDSLWKDSHAHSRAGLFQKWNSDLDRIWLELARDIENKEYENKKKDFDSFENKLKERGSFEDKGSEGFEEISNTKIKKRDEQYKILMDKQLFLARLENELGKGTTFGDGDEGDWE